MCWPGCRKQRNRRVSLLAFSSLFFSAFVAATLLPAQSELVLAGMTVKNVAPVWQLVCVAALGNTLGSATNWLLGRLCVRYRHKNWFPVKNEALEKGEVWYRTYGRWSLLLSWVPIIGDPLTLAAGLLREPFASFIVIVGVAKFTRYALVAFVVLPFSG